MEWAAGGVGPYGEPETFRPRVGAGLVPARRGNPGDTEAPGESVPPGGVPRGALPSWAFPLGWVSGGEEIAIFPSRGSFLFGSFSLDKQRERISSPRVFAKASGNPKSYRAGDRKGRPYGIAETRACPRANQGVGPYGMRYVLIQLRTPYSELRIVKGVGPYDITVRSCIIPNSEPPSGTNPLRALRAHLPLLRGGYAASDQCAYPSRYAQFRTPNSEFRTVKGVGPYHALRKKRALTFVRALFCCVRGITPSWPWPGQPGS